MRDPLVVVSVEPKQRGVALARQFSDGALQFGDGRVGDGGHARPPSPANIARGRVTTNSVNFIDLAVDRDRAAVLLGDDVVGDRQAEAGAFAGRLGGEERLEQLVADVLGDAGAVVAHADFHRVAPDRAW